MYDQLQEQGTNHYTSWRSLVGRNETNTPLFAIYNNLNICSIKSIKQALQPLGD